MFVQVHEASIACSGGRRIKYAFCLIVSIFFREEMGMQHGHGCEISILEFIHFLRELWLWVCLPSLFDSLRALSHLQSEDSEEHVNNQV